MTHNKSLVNLNKSFVKLINKKERKLTVMILAGVVLFRAHTVVVICGPLLRVIQIMLLFQ